MSFDESFLAAEARAYLASRIPVPHPVMVRIEEEARKEGQPAVGREVGSLLRSLALARRARRILEVGTNLGYSALWLASGLAPDGRLETVEIDPDLARRARGAFRDAGVAHRITVHEGAALDVLPRLPAGEYDLVFLDAVKSEYPAYLDHALRLLGPGGIVAADNLFWHGDAWAPGADDPDTRGIRAYTDRIFSDPRLASTLVGIEDGVGVSVVVAQTGSP